MGEGEGGRQGGEVRERGTEGAREERKGREGWMEAGKRKGEKGKTGEGGGTERGSKRGVAGGTGLHIWGLYFLLQGALSSIPKKTFRRNLVVGLGNNSILLQ